MPKIPDSLKSSAEDAILAICLTDLDRTDPMIRTMLLGGKVDTTTAILVDKNRFDEIAVAFTCDLLMAACICDTIRLKDRRNGDYPTRVYIRRAKKWVKLAGEVHLALVTSTADGKNCILNPVVFPELGIVAPNL